MEFEKKPVSRDYLHLVDKLLDLMAPAFGDESLRERTKLLAERILFIGIDKEASHE